jgi:WD40 repeat protein
MRGRALGGLVVATFVLAVSEASQAGVVVFHSDRCADAQDLANRRLKVPIPAGPTEKCRYAIWRVNDDGTGLARLTDGGSQDLDQDQSAAWSPDGRKIAFVGTRAPQTQFGAGRLFVMDSAGSGQRQVSPPGVGVADPGWSPDGRRFVFISQGDLHLMNVDGSGIQRLTHTPGDLEQKPTFSPDGRRILFFRRPSPLGPVPPQSLDDAGLYSVAPDGSQEARLTAGDVPVWGGASYSPDGRYIALGIGGSLFTMTAEGNDFQQWTEGFGDSDPKWTERGSTLLYQRPTAVGASSIFKVKLSADNPTPVQLTRGIGYDTAPDWTAGALLDLDPLLDPILDKLPPVVELIDKEERGLTSARLRGRSRPAEPRVVRATKVRVTAGQLGFVAMDLSGIRRLETSIARGAGHRGGKRICRFVRGRRFGSRRPCAKPVYVRIRGGSDWSSLMKNLKPGRYRIAFRTTDVRGNKTRKPKARVVDLVK